MSDTKKQLSQVLSDLHAKDKGTYYQVLCPECGEHEAYIYKNSLRAIEQGTSHTLRIFCSRLNNCGKTTIVEDVWQDIDNANLVTFDENVEASKYPTDAVSSRITALANLNTLINGYERLDGWRGISKQVLLDNDIVYLAKKPFPKGWLTFMEQRRDDVPDRYFEKKRLYSCRDIVIPFKNEDGLVDRVLLRSFWKKDAFPKEVTFKMTPRSVPVWNVKDIKGNGDILFVTEGVPDALSIKEVAHNALVVALPGVGQWKHFVRKLNESDTFKKEVIICFDSDKAGKKAAKALHESLSKLGIQSKDFDLCSYKDMNDFLLGNKSLFEQNVKNCLKSQSIRQPQKVVFNTKKRGKIYDTI